jgi:hypothetical protein
MAIAAVPPYVPKYYLRPAKAIRAIADIVLDVKRR